MHTPARPPEDPPADGPDLVFLCRNFYEKTLLDEIGGELRHAGLPPASAAETRNGLAMLRRLDDAQKGFLENRELVFERQRLVRPRLFTAASVKTCAQSLIRHLFPLVDASDLPWTLHAFTPDVEECKPLRGRVKNIAEDILDKLKRRFGRMHRRYVPAREMNRQAPPHLVVQLCMAESGRLLASAGEKTPQMHPFPGGEQRMPFDAQAPSRSYLKLCEVVSRLAAPPSPGETAVDLGAAPGGWSYFLLKQGCRVTAVDNGPLKIKSGDTRDLNILKTDGMRFQPGPGVCFDWLCCDMLRPPAQTLELLERWIAEGWMRRFVVNFKLPQKNPALFVTDLRRKLEGAGLVSLSLKHLYHDRDEITAVGELPLLTRPTAGPLHTPRRSPRSPG